jgi:predicted metalloendopeptidase
MNKFAYLFACSLAVGSTVCLAAAAAPLGSGIETQYIDAKVRVQDDFYQHVNGGWLSTVEIPADRGRFGSFDKLNDDTQEQLRGLVENLSRNRMARTPDQQKIVDLYASFMNEAAIERVGTEPLQRAFTRIDGFTDKTQLAALLAHYNRVGVQTLLGTGVHQDAKDSTQYVFDIGQSGLGLPDRDYYLQDEARLKAIREQYTLHIARMFTLAGVTNASEQAALVANFETALAHIQWSRVENRDPVKTYNRVPLAQLAALAPGFNWTAYLADTGVTGRANSVIISQPSYITELDKLVQQTPIATLQSYFRWHALSSFAPYMGKAFVDERFAFAGKTLRGIEENRPRWKRGIALVDGTIGEGLGQMYVARYFPPESKQRMDQLVRNLIAAYKSSIDKLDWMGPETRKRAQAKLAKFSVKIGYPETWRDYSALQVVAGDVVGNVLRSNEFDYNRDLNKLGKPIDRNEWGMNPQTVNAYYNPEQNVIVFPAAILQPPFFNAKADDAANYGGIGAVIGHEISHGFDDQGSQYDGDGNLLGVPGWFTQKDLDQFKARTKALVGQYNAVEPVSGFHINGELTLGENIADNSGLAIAYKAYQLSLGGKKAPVIDGLTGAQRFYFGWAQVWRSKTRDSELVVQIKSDPHSPGQTRGALPPTNQASFYEAFGIKPGDKMYRAPADRVTLW